MTDEPTTASTAPTEPAPDGVVHRADGLKHLTPGYASAFLGLLRAGDRLDRELGAELERTHGLTLRAFEVLLFLAVFSRDGRLGMSELTANAPLSQSRVSRLVADLEGRGLVTRTAVEGDARAVELAITPAGIETFRAAQDTHLAGLERRLFSRLTPTEIRQLARITGKLLDPDD